MKQNPPSVQKRVSQVFWKKQREFLDRTEINSGTKTDKVASEKNGRGYVKWTIGTGESNDFIVSLVNIKNEASYTI